MNVLFEFSVKSLRSSNELAEKLIYNIQGIIRDSVGFGVVSWFNHSFTAMKSWNSSLSNFDKNEYAV